MRSCGINARWILCLSVLISISIVSPVVWSTVVNDIRAWNAPDHTRVVFDADSPVEYKLFELKKPARIVIDITRGELADPLPPKIDLAGRVKRIRVGERENALRFVFDLGSAIRIEHFTLKPNEIYGNRLVIDFFPDVVTPEVQEETKKRSEVLVIIDAGHGGEDPGAIGYKKTYEKHVVLKIARQLKKELDKEPGIKAKLTRDGDYYIPLRKRIQIATRERADLFISVHADAAERRGAKGISVFALSQSGATSERARLLASKENASDMLAGENIVNRNKNVAEVIAGLSFDGTIDRSITLGALVRKHLAGVGPMHGNDVEQGWVRSTESTANPFNFSRSWIYF